MIALTRLLVFALGVLTITVAYPFVGPTETEIILWGQIVICFGFCMFIFSMLPNRWLHRLKVPYLFMVALLLVSQIPPIALYLYLSEYIPTDVGFMFEIPLGFYAIPYMIIFILSAYILLKLRDIKEVL